MYCSSNVSTILLAVLLVSGTLVSIPAIANPAQEAVMSGNITEVSAWLKADNTIIASCNQEGDTLLHIAVRNGFKEIVKLLLRNGADPLVKNYRGETAAHYASCVNDVEILKLLLEKPLNINIRDFTGNTPLLLAAESGNAENVKYLIKVGADPKISNDDGSAPISKAYTNDVVDLLINKGANINHADEMGNTPLHNASGKCSMEVVEHMIKLGANIKAKNQYDMSPIHMASKSGNIDAISALIKSGANINERTSKNGWTPIYFACKNGDLKVFNYLLKAGADINACDSNGESLLHIVSSMPRCGDFMTIILSKGIKLDSIDSYGNTPLHQAIISNNLSAARYLLDKGANPNIKNNKGLTPLHFAILNIKYGRGGENLVDLLLSKQADPMLKDSEGMTVISLAENGGVNAAVITSLKKHENKD